MPVISEPNASNFVARFQFGGDCHEGAVEIVDRQALEMFLHALGEPQPAEQAAAADGEIQEGGDAAHGPRAGEAFQARRACPAR